MMRDASRSFVRVFPATFIADQGLNNNFSKVFSGFAKKPGGSYGNALAFSATKTKRDSLRLDASSAAVA